MFFLDNYNTDSFKNVLLSQKMLIPYTLDHVLPLHFFNAYINKDTGAETLSLPLYQRGHIPPSPSFSLKNKTTATKENPKLSLWHDHIDA